MRTPIAISLALTLVAAPAALAKKPDDKPGKDKKPPKTSPYACVPQTVGYKARGTLVSGSATQTAGADTAQRGDDRYSGTVTVAVTKGNHNSPTGEQTFALDNVRVKFHPRNDTTVAAGDRIKLSGKITKVSKKCADNTFTPTVTIRKVDVKAAKTPKPV